MCVCVYIIRRRGLLLLPSAQMVGEFLGDPPFLGLLPLLRRTVYSQHAPLPVRTRSGEARAAVRTELQAGVGAGR